MATLLSVGLGAGERTIEAGKSCPADARVREIGTQQSFAAGLVEQICLGLYSPYDDEVLCAPTAPAP
jgi:hypothetical protein